MATINPEHTKAVLKLINKAPYFEHLNMDVQELDKGYCKIQVQIEQKHLNAFGGIHGGVYASILDTAAYWALYCEMDEDEGFITIDCKTDNLRAANKGIVTVEGGVIKRGRSICLCEAKATDEQENLLAYCTAKQFVSPSLQTISAAVDSLGQKAGMDSLPPKFL